jgi:cytochrome b subunit of formate dehydrogenase
MLMRETPRLRYLLPFYIIWAFAQVFVFASSSRADHNAFSKNDVDTISSQEEVLSAGKLPKKDMLDDNIIVNSMFLNNFYQFSDYLARSNMDAFGELND